MKQISPYRERANHLQQLTTNCHHRATSNPNVLFMVVITIVFVAVVVVVLWSGLVAAHLGYPKPIVERNTCVRIARSANTE